MVGFLSFSWQAPTCGIIPKTFCPNIAGGNPCGGICKFTEGWALSSERYLSFSAACLFWSRLACASKGFLCSPVSPFHCSPRTLVTSTIDSPGLDFRTAGLFASQKNKYAVLALTGFLMVGNWSAIAESYLFFAILASFTESLPEALDEEAGAFFSVAGSSTGSDSHLSNTDLWTSLASMGDSNLPSFHFCLGST